jgi:hypothetical protein
MFLLPHFWSLSVQPDMSSFSSWEAGDEDVEYWLGGSEGGHDTMESEEFRLLPDEDEVGNTPGATLLDGPHTTGDKLLLQQRSTMLKWLSDDYANARERLTAEMKCNPSQ